MRTLFGSPGLDFMYISASAPDAPPLRVTTTGCFIRLFFWMAACIMRAIWSEAPPAPAATTISTGLVGSHAYTGPAARETARAEAAKAAMGLRMGTPPLYVAFYNSGHVRRYAHRRQQPS